jgi:hypothetical protein
MPRVSFRHIPKRVCIPRALTRRLEEFLCRAQDDIAVAVGAEEAADQCPPVCHANAHSLVEQRLQLLSGTRSRRVFALPVRVLLRAGHALTPRIPSCPPACGTTAPDSPRGTDTKPRGCRELQFSLLSPHLAARLPLNPGIQAHANPGAGAALTPTATAILFS